MVHELNNTEKFMICSLGKGLTVKKMCSDKLFTCLVLSEIMELSDKKIIELDEKRNITNINVFNSDRTYLENVYNDLKDGGYKKVQSYIEKYIYSLTTKGSKMLVKDVIDYLLQNSLITEVNKKGFLEDKVDYTVITDITSEIVNEVVAEYNKEKMDNKKTIYLSALLLVSGILAKYVSKDEIKKINKKIKVLRKEDPNLFVKEIWDKIFSSELVSFAVSSI